MNIEHALRRALHSRLDPLNAPALEPKLLRRTRARRFSLLAVASGGLAIILTTGALAFQMTTSSDRDGDKPVASETSATPSPSATPEDPSACILGPWATHCPEAQWARGVAERAGYSLIGETGSALIISNGTYSFYFWAFEPEDPSARQEALQSENYELLTQIDDMRVYFDGIRLTWEVHGLYAWLNAGPKRGPTTTERDVIAEIVRASRDLPYP